jgi:hypothetical protein
VTVQLTPKPFRVASTDSFSLSNIPLLVVETEAVKNRTHRRVLGDMSDHNSQLYGKPVLYIDLYGNVDENPTIYAYARHRVNPTKFMQLLNDFVEEMKPSYGELRDREFQVWANVNAELKEFAVRFPILPSLFGGELSFIRVSIPFGDVAIEFRPPKRETDSELDEVRRGELTGMTEAPLFGCDVTQSTEASALFARLHWAKDAEISPEMFNNLLKRSTALLQRT